MLSTLPSPPVDTYKALKQAIAQGKRDALEELDQIFIHFGYKARNLEQVELLRLREKAQFVEIDQKINE
jgi:hypothetical protein